MFNPRARNDPTVMVTLLRRFLAFIVTLAESESWDILDKGYTHKGDQSGVDEAFDHACPFCIPRPYTGHLFLMLHWPDLVMASVHGLRAWPRWTTWTVIRALVDRLRLSQRSRAAHPTRTTRGRSGLLLSSSGQGLRTCQQRSVCIDR